MICLDDMVQLRDYCTTISANVCYVDDLPGYPAKALELITNKDTRTGIEIFEKIKRRACKTLVLDVETAMSEKFKVKTIVDSIDSGTWRQPFQFAQESNSYCGEYISLTGSKNLVTYIQSVEIFSSLAVNDSIYVYDLETGDLIDQIAFSIPSQGFYTIDIKKRYSGYRKLFIGYDTDVVNSYCSDEHNYEYFKNICKPCKCTSTQARQVCFDKSEQIIYRNIEYTNCSGLIVNYSLQCCLDNWICENANKIAPLYQHLLGLELSIEIAASHRVNEVTLSDKLDDFSNYCAKTYNKRLEQLAKGAQIKDSVCVPCAPKFKKVAFHP